MKTHRFWLLALLIAFPIVGGAGLGALLIRTHDSLVDAKGGSLRAQGEAIAALLAAARTAAPDPESARGKGLAPEQVAPILRRLVPGPATRARVYAQDGTVLVDTAVPLRERTSGTLAQTWAGVGHWLAHGEAPLYRESATGAVDFPEVRSALEGSTPAALFVIENGERIVSVAVPIRYLGSVQGVLLLSTRAGA